MVSGFASLAAPPSIAATAVAGFPDALESFLGSAVSPREDFCLSPQAMSRTTRVMIGSRMLQAICNGRAPHERTEALAFEIRAGYLGACASLFSCWRWRRRLWPNS